MNERIKFYLENINNMLSSDPEYKNIIDDVEEGKNSFRIVQKRSQKALDLTWVEQIEAVLPNLDTIIRNPRRFIVIEEDIIDVSLARSVSKESVKHLATHTGLISAVEGERIIPSKILNIQKEESVEIYENRFIYTLIRKLAEFVQVRYEAVKNAVINDDKAQISVESLYTARGTQMLVRLDTIANMTFEDSIHLNKDDLNEYERVARIQSILNGFRNSAFFKDMKKCTPVRPPITHTNVLKNDQNFKRALKLWEFIFSYEKPGFDVTYIDEATPINKNISENYKGIMYLNHLIVKELLRDEEIKNSLGYTNLKISDELPFVPNELERVLCVPSLEVFLLKVKNDLNELSVEVNNKVNERKSRLKHEKHLSTVRVLEGYFLTNQFNKLENKYIALIKQKFSKLKPTEYEGFDLKNVKEDYTKRLKDMLQNTYTSLKNLIFDEKDC